VKPRRCLAPLEARFRKSHPLNTLFHLYDGLRGKVLLALTFQIIKHSPAWVTPIVIAKIITIISRPTEHTLAEMWLLIAVALAFTLQNIPSYVTHVYFMRSAVRRMEMELRSALLRRMQQLSIAFHDDFRSGRLQSKVLRDVESVEILTDHIINSIVPAIVSMIIAISITLRKEPVIMLFYALTVPVTALLVYSFRSRVKSRNREFRNEIEQMTARVSEMIEMIPITRAHGVEDTELEKMNTQLSRVQDRGFRLDMINSVFVSSGWAVFQVFQLLCLTATGYMAYKGRIPVGDVVLYQGFFGMIVGSVLQIVNIYPQLTRGFESI
jgi:ATP-binding cassette subfamily B protein